MPVAPTYPGVYIQEAPSGVHTIIGVATSITAFVGRALRGPTNVPVRIQSFADLERTFGGLSVDSMMSYAVQQFFLNGGTDALVVRVTAANATKSVIKLNGNLSLEASSEGSWGDKLRARVDTKTRTPDPDFGETASNLFNLSIKDMGSGLVEIHRNVSTDATHRSYVTNVLEQQSALVRVTGAVPQQAPTAHAALASSGDDPFSDKTPSTYTVVTTKGNDGGALTDAVIVGVAKDKTGIYALEKADLFNILCLPPPTRDSDIADSTWSAAAAFCERRRAILLVDPPAAWTTVDAAETGADGVVAGGRHRNAVLYFPRVQMADAKLGGAVQAFVPCGVIAGVYARTDTQRGVWKAPAGIEATLTGVRALSYGLTDGENGRLNPVGVSCLRSFRVIGNVVWGARTLVGADLLASEWKYVPVRRFALFIEESLYRGTQWVVFEPNDEPLWSQIRLNVGAFMHSLFRQGAFQGRTPREAYFVKCDRETTTQDDINRGIVNIVVGFAPLKPAEFVIITIQQIAGQIEV